MPRAAPSNFRSRAGAIAGVIGGHVAVIVLLVAHREAGIPAFDDERMTLVFVEPLPEAAPPVGRPARSSRAAAPSSAGFPIRSVEAPPRTSAPSAPGESSAITPGVDWYSQAGQAASRAAAGPTTRRFDFPEREPAPRQKKEFAWDKTHTERVHALDGGGIGIALGDNCELVIAPFPMAGCALGKRKARGDLFDEMKAPPVMGDWKEK